MNSFDWDDLRVFLAVYRRRSVRSAARSLAVSHSTASRRLENLETKLGAKLFHRSPDIRRFVERENERSDVHLCTVRE